MNENNMILQKKKVFFFKFKKLFKMHQNVII